MAYFSNGTEGERYEDRWCRYCVHSVGCAIWSAHLGFSGDSSAQPVLDVLIPMVGGVADRCCSFIHLRSTVKIREWVIPDVTRSRPPRTESWEFNDLPHLSDEEEETIRKSFAPFAQHLFDNATAEKRAEILADEGEWYEEYQPKEFLMILGETWSLLGREPIDEEKEFFSEGLYTCLFNLCRDAAEKVETPQDPE